MAVNLKRDTDSRPPSSFSAEPLKIPRTPLESRQGYHPKSDDRLKWTTPPSRQLSRQKRVEYESDIRERFYDDYMGTRADGDARNEVFTTSQLAKHRHDPNLYRVNAYTGLNYDPMRPVPTSVDLRGKLEQEKRWEKQRQTRQRRLSEPAMGASHYGGFNAQAAAYERPRGGITLPPIQQERPRSALQKSLDDVIAPELQPGIEDWLQTASKKDQAVAGDFLRTISSQGKRPDPATKAAVHRSRVKSAVMTPVRKQRDEAMAAFEQMSRDVSKGKKSESEPLHRMRRTNSGKQAKGSTFAVTREMPSHYTVHPDWASESVGRPKRK